MVKWSGLTLLLLLVGAFAFSPYHHVNGKQQVRVSIEISEPVAKVFNYMGNSDYASVWSTYVDHIRPLNSRVVPDGHEGSTRRCFQELDESGIRWDELILKVLENERRVLIIYNTHKFPIMVEGLQTSQEYAVMTDKKTALSLSLYLNRKPRFWEGLKFRLAAWKIKSVFQGNLENIKKQMENHG